MANKPKYQSRAKVPKIQDTFVGQAVSAVGNAANAVKNFATNQTSDTKGYSKIVRVNPDLKKVRKDAGNGNGNGNGKYK